MGLGLLVFFVLLRFTNWYGDPIDWSVQATPLLTFLSFINVDKYPASLLYLSIMLGFALIFLAVLERVKNRLTAMLTVFGRTAFFITYFTSILFMRWLPVFFYAWTHYGRGIQSRKSLSFFVCGPWRRSFVERGVYGLDWCHCFFISVVLFLRSI